jgi:His-Xaa-Ser system protein HxsD
MEKFYTINGNYAEISLSKEIYPLISIKKALGNFTEETYIKINNNNDEIVIQLELRKNKEDLEKIIGELYDELLRESLRYDITLETKNLRELIIGRALYTTCIDLDEKIEDMQCKTEITENYNLDEIAINWFDKYKNKEE